MSGDTVAMSVVQVSSSPTPTRGFFQTQVHSPGIIDGSVGRA